MDSAKVNKIDDTVARQFEKLPPKDQDMIALFMNCLIKMQNGTASKRAKEILADINHLLAEAKTAGKKLDRNALDAKTIELAAELKIA